MNETNTDGHNPLIDVHDADTTRDNVRCSLEFLSSAASGMESTGHDERTSHGLSLLLTACADALAYRYPRKA